MDPLLQKLAERKVGQWTLAYAGAAWMVLEFVNLIGQTWGLPARTEQGIQIVLLLGLPLTVLVAWFHGAKGRQRITGIELTGFAVVVGVGALALAVWAGPSVPAGEVEVIRLIVLPFDAPAGDTTTISVAESLRDAVSDEIGRHVGIDVISRSSALRYGSGSASLASIASDLGVQALVDGAVTRVEDEITFRISLFDPHVEQPLLSDIFYLSEADVLRGIRDVARALAIAVQPRLRGEVEVPSRAGWTVSRLAWVPYARARSLVLATSPEAHVRAQEFIQRALIEDSTWAAPYALLARWHVLSTFFGAEQESSFEAARRSANRAVSLDRTSSEAFLALSQVQYHYDWDWLGAEASLEAALQLAPQDSEARVWAAQVFSIWGRSAEAIAHGLRAVELDPLSCFALSQLSMAYHLAGRYDEAAARALECIELDPGFDLAYYRLAWAEQGRGRFDEAQRTADGALARFSSVLPGRWRLFAAEVFAHTGGDDRAQALLNDVRSRGLPNGSGGTVASIYVGLGEPDLAMERLRAVVNERTDPDPLYGLALARLSPIREHPDFSQLLEALAPPASMGLDSRAP